MGFKDKDVKAAQAIFKGQEEKADHVEYEFQTWKGEFFFLVTVIWYIFVNPLAYRDSSWFRRTTEFRGARCQGWIRGGS
jgi:hypothetical protein